MPKKLTRHTSVSSFQQLIEDNLFKAPPKERYQFWQYAT